MPLSTNFCTPSQIVLLAFFIFYCFRILLQILFLKLRKFKRINEPLLANKAKYIYQCYICYYKVPHSLQILEKIFDHDFELQEFVGNLFEKLNYEKKFAWNIENEPKNVQQAANFSVLLFATCKLLIYPINPKSTINWNFSKLAKVS